MSSTTMPKLPDSLVPLWDENLASVYQRLSESSIDDITKNVPQEMTFLA